MSYQAKSWNGSRRRSNPASWDPVHRRRNELLIRVARWWARREIRRRLDGLRVAGLQEARATASTRPVLFVANHVAFWDVFLILALDEALGTEGYAVMDEENVCRVPLFRRLGAIPIKRTYPRAGLAAAATFLQRPGRPVWIFPQGENRPAHLRPLGFRRGVRRLARLTPQAAIVPVGIEYAYAESQGPVCYASFGEALSAATVAAATGVQALEQAVEGEIERIDRYLAGAPEPFDPLVASREWSRHLGVGMRLLNAITASPRRSGPARRSPDTPPA